jgi:hypothetical protein
MKVVDVKEIISPGRKRPPRLRKYLKTSLLIDPLCLLSHHRKRNCLNSVGAEEIERRDGFHLL